MPVYDQSKPKDVLAFIRTLPTRKRQYAWYKSIRKGHARKDCYDQFPKTLEEFIKQEDEG